MGFTGTFALPQKVQIFPRDSFAVVYSLGLYTSSCLCLAVITRFIVFRSTTLDPFASRWGFGTLGSPPPNRHSEK